jgi:hypothetical protein
MDFKPLFEGRPCGCPGVSGDPHLAECDFYNDDEEPISPEAVAKDREGDAADYLTRFNPNINQMANALGRAEHTHAVIHALGLENSTAHQEICDAGEAAQYLLRRSIKALWN